MSLKLNDLPLRSKPGAVGGLELDPAQLQTATPEAAMVAAFLTGRIGLAERSTWMQRLTADRESAGAALAALPFNAEIFEENGASLRAAFAAQKAAKTAAKAPAPTAKTVAAVPTPPPPTATASGIDPAAMAGVSHPYAREAIAAEPDRGKAYEMIQRYTGSDGEIQAGVDACAPSYGASNAVAKVASRHQEARNYAAAEAMKTPPSTGPAW